MTNYVGLPIALTVGAAGTVPLTYQWSKVGVGPVGDNANAYAIAHGDLSDSGDLLGPYQQQQGQRGQPDRDDDSAAAADDTAGAARNGAATCRFDGSYADTSGRGHNGTPIGIKRHEQALVAITRTPDPGPLTWVPDGPVSGHQALHYYTSADDTNSLSFNYVSLGYQPDLTFPVERQLHGFPIGSVRQTTRRATLPVHHGHGWLDVRNGLRVLLQAMAPDATQGAGTWGGSWAYSIYDASGNGIGFYSYPQGNINDGNWHQVTHVFDRQAQPVTYLDGRGFPSRSIKREAV